jgi:hypothetical protein
MGFLPGVITMPRQPKDASPHADGSPHGRRRVVRPRTPFVIPPYDHGEEAEGYARRGLSVIPLVPGSKKGQIKWKKYQTQAPTSDEVGRWWGTWPDAGVAVVLGPVSGVLAVDVDGPEAHAELVRRLGPEPAAPKILTGSGKPFRYQLLFRHPPGLASRAKITPWHPQLEFRGRGGLTVLPPSVHKSGKRYRWAPGRSLDELELPDLPPLILDALQARADADADRTADGSAGVVIPAHLLGEVQQRALSLITKKLTAVEGKLGDKATFTAACYLVRDFGLPVEDALPVLKAWNLTHCRPVWGEEQLLYKLRKADDWAGSRGRLLGSAIAAQAGGRETKVRTEAAVGFPRRVAPMASPDGARPPYLLPVPDWVLSPWELAKPREQAVRRGRPLRSGGVIFPLALASVVLQKSSVVRLPDVALAQLVWGGDQADWPARWRAKLASRLTRVVTQGLFAVEAEGADCPVGCPLHGTRDTRHRHLRLRVISDNILGFFHPFATGGTKEGGCTYAFEALRSHHPDPAAAKAKTKEIRELRKDGSLCAIYLPAWVFGPLALPAGPCRVLKAVTRELTRRRGGRAERADRAEVVPGSANPMLDAARSYVAFNGNGSRRRPQFHGRGYSIGAWMKRAGYPHDPGAASFRAAAREFLGDLKSLNGPLGLVTAVRVPGRSDWVTIDEGMEEVTVVRPHRLARKCLIRVYGPADYPDRWRAYFASQLGLGMIPRGEPGEAGPPPSGTAIVTHEELARWMKRSGLTDAGLAEMLGVSRTLVCKYRTGSRALSRDFQMKVAPLVTGSEGATDGRV